MRNPKLADLVVDELKGWITARGLQPGDKLAKEGELQAQFGVSKATTREALKSLEVQGLISMSTGPNGGAKIEKVPFSSAFQHLQSYLYFTNLNPAHLYAVRALLEPELIAGAIPHLTDADTAALENSIAICEAPPRDQAHAALQRQEDLAFHAIIARAHPNPLLRFIVEFVNEALQRLVAPTKIATAPANRRFGEANVHAHHEILAAIKARKPEKARALMRAHIAEVEAQVMSMRTTLKQRFVLESELIQPAGIPTHPRKKPRGDTARKQGAMG